MKRILVLGDKGMLGHVVVKYFKKLYDVVVLDKYIYQDNLKSIEKDILDMKVDVIVNCIGTLVKESEDNKRKAVFTNTFLPHYFDYFCKVNGIKFVHISTNCVFEGRKSGYYKENEKTNATDFYGMTKAVGEKIDSLVVRTSIIGPELKENGTGLWNWFTHQNGEVKGYTSVHWNGVTTYQLAKALSTFIDKDVQGIYNYCCKNSISKYNLLKLIQAIYDIRNINIIIDDSKFEDKTLMDTRKILEPPMTYTMMIEEMQEFYK